MGSKAWLPVWLCPWPGGAGAGQWFVAGLLWPWAGLVLRACPVDSCLGSSLSSSREVGLSGAGTQAGHKCCAASASSSAPFEDMWGCHLQKRPRGSLIPTARSLPEWQSVRSCLVSFCSRGDFDEHGTSCTGVRWVALAALPWALFAIRAVDISIVLFLFLPPAP